jgi:hypothetical protein
MAKGHDDTGMHGARKALNINDTERIFPPEWRRVGDERQNQRFNAVPCVKSE